MHEPIRELEKWLADMEGKQPVEWDLLPDIGLYMDQVQTYIDKQLSLYRKDDQDRLLTSAMINNYIKDGMIPRADSKKYSPTHLSLLIMIGTLKQVLSMQNLNRLLSSCRDPQAAASLYSRFLEIQKDALSESSRLTRNETQLLQDTEADSCEDNETALRGLALKLSIEARTRILIAEKILAMVNQPEVSEESTRQHKKSGKNEKKK